MADQSESAAPGIVRRRGFRCLLAALFTAGVLVAVVSVFSLVPADGWVMLFLLTLAIAFGSAQVHERFMRQGTGD